MKPDFKVGIDVSALDPKFKEHSTRGIGKYAREFQKFLITNQIASPNYGFFNHHDVLENSILAKLIQYAPCGRQTLKQQLLYPFRLSGKKLQQFSHLHFLAQMDAPTWCAKPYILTVMDIIPIVCKELYQANNPNWRYHLARFFELQAIRNASKIITISECSKKDLVKHLKIDPEKIYVTPLGVDPIYFQDSSVGFNDLISKFQLPEDLTFLLYVGGIDPRKNYQGLIKTFSKLKKIYLAANSDHKLPKLLLVGRINQDKEYPKLQKLIKDLGLESDVIELGYVTEEELITLYRNCLAMCFFSLYEGFGLTPLEALAAGAKVFSTKLSAMPEVLGDAVHYLESDEDDANAQKIFEVLNNSMTLDRLTDGQIQAKKFTWDRTWELTLKVYEDAARTY